MPICRTDFWSFIIDLVTRNPNLGIPALEDGLVANLSIFDYLYWLRDGYRDDIFQALSVQTNIIELGLLRALIVLSVYFVLMHSLY